MVGARDRVRVAFFGTSAFAIPVLRALVTASYPLVVVVTQPDRPSGRGQRPHPSPVKRLAEELGIPALQPERLKTPELLEALRARAPQVGVIAAYGKILPSTLLDLPPWGFLNVHASLLPKYRGAAPVQRAVMAGETETGVTIMRVVPALDAGPILAYCPRPVGPDETSQEIERDLAELGGPLLVETLDRLVAGRVDETPQDERLATYAPRLAKEEGRIDWHRPAAELHNQVRGLHPWPHAYTFLGGTRLILLRSRPDPGRTADAPGTIVEARGHDLCVAAGAGSMLRILEIQPEGRRSMSAQEFLAGHHDLVGRRLG